MKKNIFISLIMTIAVFISCFSMPVNAAQEDKVVSTSIEYFEDGSYLVTTITEEINNARATTKTGTKTSTYKNSDGEALWVYRVTGTYSYTGTSSTCTSVYDSYNIYDTNWKLSSKSCSKSGNTAYGTVTMKHYTLGILTNTVSDSLSLTCSATGVLS